MSEARIHLDAQVQVRRDTEANWIAVDPVLRDGEIAYSRDINRIKVGDGAHKWSELEYMLSVDAPDYEDIDLSEYAKKEEVTTLSELLASMWTLDEDGNLVTEKNVIIKKNLTIGGDMASDGEGGQGTVTGVTSIVIDDETYNAVDGKIDLSEAFEGLDVDVDLSNYYTKDETADLLSKAIAGIDLSGYALKSDVNKAIADLINGAPETLDTLKEVADALAENADAVDALNAAIGNKADKATTLAGYGITDAYTQTVIDEKIGTVSKAVSDLDTKYIPVKTWYDELASLIVKEGSNVRIKTNLLIDGDQSATGEGGGAVLGITGIKLNGETYKDENNDGIIDLGTITSGLTTVSWTDVQGRPTKLTEFTNDAGFITSASLTGYAKTSDLPTKTSLGLANVENKSSATIRGEITSANVTNALGYTPANNASLANYLPSSGGTITGTTTDPIIVNTSATSVGARLQINDANKAYVGYGSSVGAYLYNYDTGAYIGVDTSGSPFYHNGTIKNTLIHSGNIGSQKVAGLATPVTIWGQSFDGTGDIANTHLNIYQHPSGVTTDWVRTVRALNSSGTILSAFGFYGSSETLNYTYIGKNYQSPWMLINASGNVTIGASDLAGTSAKLYVYGSIAAFESFNFKRENWNYITAPATSGNIAFNIGIAGTANTKMCVINSGNVGIGTTSPAYKLDVNGVARATGWIGNNVNISCDANGNTSGYSGEINRFGGGKLWIQAREGGLELGNSAGINCNGAVTMSNELFLGNNMGIYFKNASGTKVLAMYVSPSNVLQVGYNNVDRVAFQKPVTINNNLIVAGDISA